ncbi:MerR family DNA-binding transcriptional regulator [Saccharopolyspora hordei]|uniref:DNA-binding transcriptional MerR regulator n=1 Tax=Saccharopolyspora hordei TaxID=1838 RepID=A0A853AJ62_9PSEU|nr:DNA-binding transcriptional MerR regulator [Saccharopolyspora hordei]
MADETPGCLTTGQVAKRLGISPRTLARYVREGLLKPSLTLPTGHHRWLWDDVLNQLKQQRD